MSTLSPRDFNRRAKEAAVIPFPKDETTPPVTKMYLVIEIFPPRLPAGRQAYFRQDLFHFPHIFRTVHGARLLGHHRHLDGTAVFQHPQLLQTLGLLKG